jgi:hypothetical protein
LAAFDFNGNVRGVGLQLNPTFGPYQGTTIYELQLRSNNNGEVISFKYYDASQDSVLDITETYMFEINEVIGDIVNPYELNITTTVDLSIDLIAGWNWISFNLDLEDSSPDAILSQLGDDALFVNSQASGTSTNYGDYGWYGGLDEMLPTQKYKLKMANDATLTLTGIPVDLETTPINLITGWNWLGYLPQNPGAVGTAFASLGESALFVNSQASGTSTNYGDYGWYGGLSNLEPGAGYLLKMSSSATLYYPEFDGMSRLNENTLAPLLPQTISDWEFNYAEFENIATATISLESREDSYGDIVAAFVDGECRGIAERSYFPFNDSYLYTLQIYSNAADLDNEKITFKYYDNVNNEIIEFSETVTFANNMVLGDGFDTFRLNNIIVPVVNDYSLSDAYPNPFNPTTEISFAIMESGNINLSIYDMTGRLVNTLFDGNISKGYHRASWDGLDANGQAVSSGMYIYSLNGEGVSITKKMMLMK